MLLKEYQPLKLCSATTRIKMFRFRELDKVEKEINDWMSREKVIIRHVTQSQSENQGWFEFVVSVFYEIPES